MEAAAARTSKGVRDSATALRRCWVLLERIDRADHNQGNQEAPAANWTDMKNADRPFKCTRCEKAFRQPGHCKQHEVAVHDKKKPHKCTHCHCDKSFSQLSGKQGHEKLHLEKQHRCSLCNKFFHHVDALMNHIRTHTGEKPFKCKNSNCTATFKTACQFSKHKRSAHSSDSSQSQNQYKCRFCEKTYRSRSSRFTHEKLRHKGVGFSCKFCPRVCGSKHELELHEQTHTGEKPHGCTYCAKEFRRKQELQVHVRTHTGEKPYKCGECFTAFGSSSKLTRHKAVHKLEKSYSCSFCAKTFRCLEGKQYHEKCSCPRPHNSNEVKAELKHECKTCGKKYGCPSQLKVHMRNHSGETPFNCGFCSKSFTTSASCRAHQRTHTGEKPYDCKFCSKAFDSSGHRDRHEKIHTGEKLYLCQFCPATFREAGNCDVHERRHTGDKRHKCSVCEKTFVSTGDRSKHEKIHARVSRDVN